MVETGFNDTEIGKVILAACFINDIGTVLALGLVFANYNFWLLGSAGATVFALLLPASHLGSSPGSARESASRKSSSFW
jgi:Kef-type K+ transport system membrane component KefB